MSMLIWPLQQENSIRRAGGGSEAAQAATTNTIMGVREGTVWGLTSAIAFAFHLVRSEIRQHEAEDVGQLAAGQLVVCGMLSMMLLCWTGITDPEVTKEISLDVIASVRVLRSSNSHSAVARLVCSMCFIQLCSSEFPRPL